MIESLPSAVSTQVIILVLICIALIACTVYLVLRAFRKPKDKEKRRRLAVNQRGRLGDATITEVEDATIFYEYSVRGVGYTASQDVSQLRERIPTDPRRLIGPATLKYSPENPANSIIVCEEWSGLRLGSPSASQSHKQSTLE